MSPEGRCKTFDKDANGYVRAEAINIIFLQKSKDAKRVYAQILHAKTNCDGYKEQGITYPAGNIQKMLLREFYDECEIAPVSLEAIEAHGTGKFYSNFIFENMYCTLNINNFCPTKFYGCDLNLLKYRNSSINV